MIRRFHVRVLATIALSWPCALFAQQSTQAAAKLPETPVPSRASTSTRPPGIIDPHTFSSSSSTLSSEPQPWISTDPNAQQTVLEDTLLRVITNDPLSTTSTRAGTSLTFTLSEDVLIDGRVIIPRGAAIRGTVLGSRRASTLTGHPELILQLTSLDLGGHSYPVYTYPFKVVGASKTKPTETKVKAGAVIGAIVGGAFSGSANGGTTALGRVAGMGTGAVLGAGAGAAVSAATPGPILAIPAESQIDFYLASPISVRPATAKEAEELSRKRQSEPVLYVHGDTP